MKRLMPEQSLPIVETCYQISVQLEIFIELIVHSSVVNIIFSLNVLFVKERTIRETISKLRTNFTLLAIHPSTRVRSAVFGALYRQVE